MSESVPGLPRASRLKALHLLWTVPLAVALSFVPALIAGFSMCSGIPCWPQDMQYQNTPIAVIACLAAGLLLFLAIQLVPWSKSPGIRLLVSIPVGLLWALYWFGTSLRFFQWGFSGVPTL